MSMKPSTVVALSAGTAFAAIAGKLPHAAILLVGFSMIDDFSSIRCLF